MALELDENHEGAETWKHYSKDIGLLNVSVTPAKKTVNNIHIQNIGSCKCNKIQCLLFIQGHLLKHYLVVGVTKTHFLSVILEVGCVFSYTQHPIPLLGFTSAH